MFKANTKHESPSMFGLLASLPESVQKKALGSKEYAFYQLVFSQIEEEKFSILYSEVKSRPNSPVNVLVSAMILMAYNKWSYEELFTQIQFNLLTRIALGLDTIEEQPFSMATIFNFQNRLNAHFCKTGENLLESVFDKLTTKQLKALKIKTDIQRTDSFAAASNIRNYSRLQLLVEMILRIWRVLDDKDKSSFKEQFSSYTKRKTSGQFIYSLEKGEIPKELKKIGKLYKWINKTLRGKYDEEIFKVFDRVYKEHFITKGERIKLKSNEQMHSGCLQSPDDLDAAYRKKDNVQTKGQTVNIVETANPENKLNLITDVSVKPVNVNDDTIINERIEKLKEKTPDIKELHSDGAYGSSANDKEFSKHKIDHIQTAVKGNKKKVDIEISKPSETNNDEFIISCPYQSVPSEKTKKRFKASFDLKICSSCSLSSDCPSQKMKKHRVYYFTEENFLLSERQRKLLDIPEERRFIRNNVEATVKEFTCRMPNKKLKVRGAYKAMLFVFSAAVGINFGRIYRMMAEKTKKPADFSNFLAKYFFKLYFRITEDAKPYNIGFSQNLIVASS
jgi:hypothetical protein